MNKKLLIGIIAGVAALAVLGGSLFIVGGLNGWFDGEQTPDAGTSDASVNDVITYLKAQYADEGAETASDYKRYNVVRIAGVPFDVVWTANTDLVQIVDNGDGNAVIVVNKEAAAATNYQLTATVTKDGATATHTWNYVLPQGESMVSIVDAAYALGVGEKMDSEKTLTGTVISIDTPWDDNYKNITVSIAVAGREDKPIQCFRLKGDGARDLRQGDVITVTGYLLNYNGKIEFDAGCTLAPIINTDATADPSQGGDTTAPSQGGDTTAPTQGGDTTAPTQGGNTTAPTQGGNTTAPTQGGNTTKPTGGNTTKPTGGNTTKPTGGNTTKPTGGSKKPTTPAAILDYAYSLAEGAESPWELTLTGKVTNVDEVYNEEFGNITVTIVVDNKTDKPIVCYRLKGDGVDKIAKGDTITVTGTMKNHYGKIEFAFPNLDKRVSGGGSPIVVQTDPKKIVEAAFKLKENETLGYQATLTGTVISINEPYNAEYGNVSPLIEVEGKRILCYRAKPADGVDGSKIGIGDTITVTGDIKNHYGTIEFNFPTIDKRVAGQVTEKKMTLVDSPKAGKAYKFGMIQKNVSTSDVYYLIGGMNGYYMATGNSALSAIDVYLEETKGGYYLYTKSGSSKQYINMVLSADGLHVNGAYESKASTVYTYDKTAKTLVATMTKGEETEPYWFGTRNDKTYTTVGPCAVAYEGFYCQFYEEK